MSAKLAIDGGEKVRTEPFPTAERFGAPELEQVREALAQQTLFYASGTKVKAFEAAFAAAYGMEFCVATSSGSAALHAAVGAAGVAPGDEVIVPPISDMGTLIGILYQNAIPVFADLDPETLTLDPAAVEALIGERTRAIMPVHGQGSPCDMVALSDIASRHGLGLIEDCAQSFSAEVDGRMVGTIGHLGCFSLNDYKHISVGDGGAIVTDDPALAQRARWYTDKSYDRTGAHRTPQFLAPNYRMSEICGAVALAQLDRLQEIVQGRRRVGEALEARLAGLRGIRTQRRPAGSHSSYYRFTALIRQDELTVEPAQFARAVAAEGIPASFGGVAPGNRPLYLYDLFAAGVFEGASELPAKALRGGRLPQDWAPGLCPVAEAVFGRTITIKPDHSWSDPEIHAIGTAFTKVCAAYAT